MTRFADIAGLPQEPSGQPEREALLALGLSVPSDVFEQLLYDHGAKEEFQIQYGHLDLQRIKWHAELLVAVELAAASVYPGFQQWIDSVAKRCLSISNKDWTSFDTRPAVVKHWRMNRTWLRAPVFIDGSLVNSNASLHLMEGHTRLGALRGLLRQGFVSPDSVHEAWVGRVTDAAV